MSRRPSAYARLERLRFPTRRLPEQPVSAATGPRRRWLCALPLMLLLACNGQAATPSAAIGQAGRDTAALAKRTPPTARGSETQAPERFDLNALADSDPAVRRAALPRLPLAEYERLPAELVAELAAQLSTEVGSNLPVEIAATSAPRDAVGFLVDLAGALDAAASQTGARALAGQVVVEGGAAAPRMVTAQMPIHGQGWFATAVADPKLPLALHLHGHASVLLRLAEVAPPGEGLVVLDAPLILRPLPEAELAGIRGRIEIDGDLPPEAVQLRAWIRPYPVNHPFDRYLARDRWPEPVTIPVSSDGHFELWGFAPARHFLKATAEGFEDTDIDADLTGGEWLSLGTLRLTNSDLTYYVEPDQPEAPPLAWIDLPERAFAQAAETGRPLLAYTTAEWCAPCQLLASTTFEDPWVRAALDTLVLARVDEDEDWNTAHEAYGYPTLIFFDSAGREVHRFSGYQPPLGFLRELLQALEQMGLPAPAALSPLIEGGQLQAPVDGR